MRIPPILAIFGVLLTASSIWAETPSPEKYCISLGVKLDSKGNEEKDYRCISKDAAAKCEAAGGTITPGGFTGALGCLIHTKDAGKPCTDKSDCETACIHKGNQPPAAGAKGECADTNSPFGCYSLVERGVIRPAMCTD